MWFEFGNGDGHRNRNGTNYGYDIGIRFRIGIDYGKLLWVRMWNEYRNDFGKLFQ